MSIYANGNLVTQIAMGISQALSVFAGDVIRFGGGGINPPPYDPASLFTGGEQGGWWDLQLTQEMITYRRNLINYSSDFSNAYWTKQNTTVSGQQITETATTGVHVVHRIEVNQMAGQQFTGSIIAKAGSTDRYLRVSIVCSTANSFGFITVDLNDGSITQPPTATGTFTVQGGGVDDLGGGNYRVYITGTTPNFQQGMILVMCDQPTPPAGVDFGRVSYTGTTGFINISNAQREWNSTATPYQDIATTYPTDWLTAFPNTNLFQDSAGTTPVTAVEQPIGLCLDKSQNLELGANTIAIGDMEAGTAPTVDWTGAVGTSGFNTVNPISGTQDYLIDITTPAGARPLFLFSGTTNCVIGRMYKISFDYKVNSGTALFSLLYAGGGVISVAQSCTGSGTITAYAVAIGTSHSAGIYFGNSVCNVQIDNLQMQEVAGNHLTQATSTQRPVLSARQNLLTYSEDFSNAVWVKTGGSITGNTFTEDTATSGHSLQYTTNGTGNYVTFQAKLKYEGRQWVRITPYGAGSTTTDDAWFDILNGVVGSKQASVLSTSITDNGDGYWIITYTTNTLSGTLNIQISGSLADNSTANYVGSGLPAWSIKEAQLVYGSEPKPYQWITTATNYNSVGFVNYAKLDGIDDDWATASVDMNSTQVTVFAGYANGKTTGTGTLIESSANYLNNSGSFAALAPSLSTSRFSFGSNGGLGGGGEKEIDLAPVGSYKWHVDTMANDFTTTNDYGCDFIRVDSIPISGVIGVGNTDVGAGPYGNYPFYVGARAGTSNFLQGYISQLVAVSKNCTTPEIDATEQYIANRAGIELL